MSLHFEYKCKYTLNKSVHSAHSTKGRTKGVSCLTERIVLISAGFFDIIITYLQVYGLSCR